MDSMLFDSSQGHIRYKIIQQFMDKVISAGEFFFKAQYICSMQENTDQPLQQTIIVPTCTILNPCINVIIIIYIQDIHNNVCNRIQYKKPYK